MSTLRERVEEEALIYRGLTHTGEKNIHRREAVGDLLAGAYISGADLAMRLICAKLRERPADLSHLGTLANWLETEWGKSEV